MACFGRTARAVNFSWTARIMLLIDMIYAAAVIAFAMPFVCSFTSREAIHLKDARPHSGVGKVLRGCRARGTAFGRPFKRPMLRYQNLKWVILLQNGARNRYR